MARPSNKARLIRALMNFGHLVHVECTQYGCTAPDSKYVKGHSHPAWVLPVNSIERELGESVAWRTIRDCKDSLAESGVQLADLVSTGGSWVRFAPLWSHGSGLAHLVITCIEEPADFRGHLLVDLALETNPAIEDVTWKNHVREAVFTMQDGTTKTFEEVCGA